jgi:hypothetical protein
MKDMDATLDAAAKQVNNQADMSLVQATHFRAPNFFLHTQPQPSIGLEDLIWEFSTFP